MKTYKTPNGDILETTTYRRDLTEMVEDAFQNFTKFFEMMETSALNADEGTDKDEERITQNDIAKALFQQGMSKIGEQIDEIEKKVGIHTLVYAAFSQDVLKGGTLLDVEVVPSNGKCQTPAKAPIKTAKPKAGEIPDFRTVQPESEEEAQLQRVFEVMRAGGMEWGFLEKSIDLTWNDMVSGSTNEGGIPGTLRRMEPTPGLSTGLEVPNA